MEDEGPKKDKKYVTISDILPMSRLEAKENQGKAGEEENFDLLNKRLSMMKI